MSATKIDGQLADAENQFASSDPERAELIARARRFKSSWIELAEALVEVKRSGRFRDWGYEDFDTYAKSELHLKQETIEKLTGRYAFLQRRAPEVLARDGVAHEIPSYKAIDYLRRVEAQEDAPREVVREIEKKLLEEKVPVSQVAKEFSEKVFPISVDERNKREAAGIQNVAKRLHELLGESHMLPKKVVHETQEVLSRLLESIKAENVRAA